MARVRLLSAIIDADILIGLSFGLAAIAMSLRVGLYTPVALGLLIVAFLFAVAAVVLGFKRSPSRRSKVVLTLLLGVLLISSFSFHPIMYPAGWRTFENTVWILYACVAAFILPLYLLPAMTSYPWVRQIGFLIAVTIALMLRTLVPIASPSPIIDVYAVAQESAQHFLEGKNPFSTPIEADVYGDHRKYGYPLPGGYWYMPGNFLPQVIAYAVAGDIRYAHIIAEVVFLAVVWYMLSRRCAVLAELAVLLMLFEPMGLFVIEQAWIEPLLLAALALTLLALDRKRMRTASTLFGAFLALKQYLIFFPLHWLLVTRRASSFVFIIIGGVMCAVPFFLMAPKDFLQNAVLFQLSTGFRTDSLSLSSALYPVIGEVGKWWSITVAGVVAVIALWCLRRRGQQGFLQASMLTMFAMFVFGAQAFCNYYYFVLGLLMLTLTSAPHEETP